MAQYSSPRSPKPRSPKPSAARPSPDPLAQQLPLVSARWLLWSLAGIFGGGLALVYVTMCFLFWQGQWQILFHPAHPAPTIPAGLPIADLRFAPNLAGQPQLDGWFIPAPSDGRHAQQTILYLHSTEAGSLLSTLPELSELHRTGINIFAFDYRGFGQSENLHPSEKLATEDTEAAWQYLVETRHIEPGSIVIYGEGLGASLAAEAAAKHPDAAAIILDNPAPTALELLRADPRSHGMPLWLLAHDRFDPTQVLAAVKQPKLFLLAEQTAAGKRYAQFAADPKRIVYLLGGDAASEKMDALRRFFDNHDSVLSRMSQ